MATSSTPRRAAVGVEASGVVRAVPCWVADQRVGVHRRQRRGVTPVSRRHPIQPEAAADAAAAPAASSRHMSPAIPTAVLATRTRTPTAAATSAAAVNAADARPQH